MKILIWEARTDRHVKIEDLSKMTGISVGSLSSYENGVTSPTMDKIEKIAKALKVRIEDLYHSEYK